MPQPTNEVLRNARFNAARRVANKRGKSAAEIATDRQLLINADRAVERQAKQREAQSTDSNQ